MAFQAPFEIAQSQLLRLRLTSVDTREAPAGIHPFFDERGSVRLLMIDTRAGQGPASPDGVFAVEDFPLEIRLHKAIYPRPITRYRPLLDLDAAVLAGLYHFDGPRALAAKAALPDGLGPVLDAGNLALRARGRESLRDLFFTLDLRRLTGGLCRSGLIARRRMELAALRSFILDTAPAGA